MIFHQLPASTHGSHASTIIDLCASIDQIFLKSESETAKILVLNQDQIKNGNEWWRMDEEQACDSLVGFWIFWVFTRRIDSLNQADGIKTKRRKSLFSFDTNPSSSITN